jgi:hypothetical protein
MNVIDPVLLVLGATTVATEPLIPPPQGPNRGAVESTPLPPPVDVGESPEPPTSSLPDGVSLDLSLTWTSAYVFRGYMQEDVGLIVQPGLTVGYDLMDETAAAPSLGVYFTNWSSVQSVGTSAQRSPQDWYETDLIVGAALGYRGWTLDTAVAWYLSPSDAFDTTCELDVLVSYDLPDETWYGTVLGDPYALLAIELDNQNRGSNRNGNTYLEIGAGPSFTVSDDLSLSVPIAVGLGLHDYYFDDEGDSELFGFASVTPTISWNVAEGDFGAITLDAGVGVQFLGEGATASNGGDDTIVVGFVGLGWSF